MTYLPFDTESPFLPTSLYYPEEPSQLLIVLTDSWIQLASRVNARTIGQYQISENLTGNYYANTVDAQDPIQSFRMYIPLPAIATGATYTVAHGITGFSNLVFVDTQCEVITDAVTFNKRSVPYASATLVTDQIQIDKDDTNIRIVNGATAPNITSGLLVLEYTKN